MIFDKKTHVKKRKLDKMNYLIVRVKLMRKNSKNKKARKIQVKFMLNLCMKGGGDNGGMEEKKRQPAGSV